MRRVTLCFLLLVVSARGQPQPDPPKDLSVEERTLEESLKAKPSPKNWERLGLVRHLQNKYDSAIPAFREAVRLDPSLWTSHLFLGVCLYRTNQFAAALASLEIASRLAPKESRGRDETDFWLGATHIALKKPLVGLEALERLLQRNPRHTDALELVVRTAADASTEAWNYVAETHFDTAAGYEVHGHALESEGKRQEALDAFRRSKERSPQRAGPGLAIGRLLLLDGKAAEALEVLRQEVSLIDCHPEAFYYAGLAAVQAGRHAEAVPWLELGAKWPVRNPEAPLALAQVYLAVGNSEKAVSAARQAVAAAPSSAAAHDLLLSVLETSGLREERDFEQRRWREQQLPSAPK